MTNQQILKKTHEHLKSLKCPRCGKRMKKIAHRYWFVGCVEYELFWCYQPPDILKNNYKECNTLIINYPHESAGKDNKIIKL